MPEYEFEIAETLSRVPVHFAAGEQAREAINRLQKSLRWLDALVDRHPNILQYQRTKAHAHYRLGLLLMHSQETSDEARLNIREAVEVQAGICDQFPDSLADVAWLARMRTRLEGPQTERPESSVDAP